MGEVAKDALQIFLQTYRLNPPLPDIKSPANVLLGKRLHSVLDLHWASDILPPELPSEIVLDFSLSNGILLGLLKDT